MKINIRSIVMLSALSLLSVSAFAQKPTTKTPPAKPAGKMAPAKKMAAAKPVAKAHTGKMAAAKHATTSASKAPAKK